MSSRKSILRQIKSSKTMLTIVFGPRASCKLGCNSSITACSHSYADTLSKDGDLSPWWSDALVFCFVDKALWCVSVSLCVCVCVCAVDYQATVFGGVSVDRVPGCTMTASPLWNPSLQTVLRGMRAGVRAYTCKGSAAAVILNRERV